MRHNRNITSLKNDQSGQGLTDIIKNLSNAGKFVTKGLLKASDLYSSDMGTFVKNLSPTEQGPNANYPGEKHGVLKLKPGRNHSYAIANWMGPGTQVLKRLEKGSQPRTEVDKVSKAHDIRYTLAKDIDDIRSADEKMVSKIDEIERKKSDSRFNIAQARMIKGKIALEKMGVLPRDKFSKSLGKKIPQKDRKILEKELKTLEQDGFGPLPGADSKIGDSVRKSVISEYLKKDRVVEMPEKLSLAQLKAKKGRGVSPAGAGVSPAGAGCCKKGKGVKTTGTGVVVTGSVTSGSGILDKKTIKIIRDHMIPEILKEANLHYPEEARKAIGQISKVSKDLNDFIDKATAIATHGTFHRVLKEHEANATLAGSGYPEGMDGEGLKDLLESVLTGYNRNADKMALNLAKFVKKHLADFVKAKMEGGSIFSKIGKAFKDFAHGFSSGWNSTAKLFGKIPFVGSTVEGMIPKLPGDTYRIDFADGFKLKPNKHPVTLKDSISSIIKAAPKLVALV